MTSVRKQNVAPIFLEPGHATTCTAGAAITGQRFVTAAANGTGSRPAVTPSAAGDYAYGVAHYDAPDTAPVSVLRQGTVGVYAGEALTAGDLISAGADGKAVIAEAGTAGATLPSPVVGICVADTDNKATAPITLR